MKYYFWWDHDYTEYQQKLPALNKNIECTYLIVGGGMTGLHAALTLLQKGAKEIVLIEKWAVGRGTTGCSTGFVVPDAEAGLSTLQNQFGKQNAQFLWKFVSQGCELIAATVRKLSLQCDLEQQDSILLGLKNHAREVIEEYKALQDLDVPAQLYDADEMSSVLGASGTVSNAVQYFGTYSINPLKYCHELKMYLIRNRVTIYENTTLEQLVSGDNIAIANGKSIQYKKIINCTNQPQKNYSPLAKKIWGAQSTALISRPLRAQEIRSLFPD